MITIFDNGELETSNQKNIPKFLVVRDELPANHQGRARMPIPQNWIIFLWSSLTTVEFRSQE